MPIEGNVAQFSSASVENATADSISPISHIDFVLCIVTLSIYFLYVFQFPFIILQKPHEGENLGLASRSRSFCLLALGIPGTREKSASRCKKSSLACLAWASSLENSDD